MGCTRPAPRSAYLPWGAARQLSKALLGLNGFKAGSESPTVWKQWVPKISLCFPQQRAPVIGSCRVAAGDPLPQRRRAVPVGPDRAASQGRTDRADRLPRPPARVLWPAGVVPPPQCDIDRPALAGSPRLCGTNVRRSKTGTAGPGEGGKTLGMVNGLGSPSLSGHVLSLDQQQRSCFSFLITP